MILSSRQRLGKFGRAAGKRLECGRQHVRSKSGKDGETRKPAPDGNDDRIGSLRTSQPSSKAAKTVAKMCPFPSLEL